MGNIILKQLKVYQNDILHEEKQTLFKKQHSKFQKRLAQSRDSQKIGRLQKQMEFEAEKAIAEYEAMSQKANHER